MTLRSPGIALGRAGAVSLSRPKPVSRVLELFLIIEFACQVALMVPSLGGMRVVFRCAAFGASLAFALFLLPGKNIHPAIKPAFIGLVLVALAIFQPTTNTLMAAMMQFALYLAIAAPLLWVSNLELDSAEVRRVLLIMLAFQAVSSLVGVLQVYFPGSFRGAISTVITSKNSGYVQGLYYKNAAGQFVMRPSGLTDVPGGVSGAGQYATLLSLYFFLTERDWRIRILCSAAAVVGVAAVYLSGVKSAMICLMLSLSVFVTLLVWRSLTTRRIRATSAAERRRVSAIQLLVLTATIAAGGYYIALNIGGQGVTGATQTLTQQRPGRMFYEERGRFLEYTINNLLPEYPFGAGLGRWGMMLYYFGNPQSRNSPPIWVEIQWTAWLLDGGVPLVLAYAFAVFIAIRFAAKSALNPALGDVAVLGAVIGAYDVSVAAGTFNSVPFIGSTGVDFWMLNAMLFGAVVYAYRQARARAPLRNEAFSPSRW